MTDLAKAIEVAQETGQSLEEVTREMDAGRDPQAPPPHSGPVAAVAAEYEPEAGQ